MNAFLKLLMLPVLLGFSVKEKTGVHPLFMSVTEIEHNARDKTLEISCKIFTDDFEKTLRSSNPGTLVDLIKPTNKAAMDKLVSAYVQKHLSLVVDGKAVAMSYVGYEIIEEGANCYFQVDNIPSLKKLEVSDNILYEYKDTQFSIIHAIVNGKRQSTKINNPEAKAAFVF